MHTATGCFVVNSTMIQCAAVSGIDLDHRWTVVVGGQSSALSAILTHYARPSVGGVSPSSVQTTAGTHFTISGSNFGLAGAVSLNYGPYTATGCSITVSHVEIECDTVAGVGFDHRLVVSTAEQSSLPSGAAAALAYAKPTVTSLSAVPDLLLPTSGGRQVNIQGTNVSHGC